MNTELDMLAYARRLHERIHEAFDYDRKIVGDGDRWQPKERECHANTMRLSELDPTYSAVHGWLVCDYGYEFGFIAHSIIRGGDGRFIDITPPTGNLPWKYPFLIDEDDNYWAVSDYMEEHPHMMLRYPAEGRSQEEMRRKTEENNLETERYFRGER